jgi:hypothetical protein
MSATEMRRQRVKEMAQKYSLPEPLPTTLPSVLKESQEDDGRFVSKYFDSVANKQYQQLFCQYN